MNLKNILICLLILATRNLRAEHTPVTIFTKRLCLREFTSEDLTRLIELRSDKDFMSYSHLSTPEQTEKFLKKHLEAYQKDGFSKWAVINLETQQLIGYCGLCWVDIDGEKNVELGYRLAKEFWGRGLGTEAVIAVKNYAFTNTNLTEVVSCIDEGNFPSIRVAEKNGMTLWKKGSFMNEECLVYRTKKK